jgi:hypothetical protein
MAAIADLSDLLNRSTGGNSGTPENLWWHKEARVAGAAATAPIAGRYASLWTYDGHPSAGVAPTTWANPTNSTAGALKQTDPGGGRQKWFTGGFATGLNAGTLILYDRLGHIGNLNATTTTAQTFTGSITRYTSGVGNIAWLEIYTIIGTTGTTVTMSYTNTTPTSGRTSAAVTIGGTGFREVTRCLMLPLQSGDTGITSVENVDLLASTATAGAFGLTIAHPLAYYTIGAAGAAGWRDYSTGNPGIPEIQTGACLALLWVPQTTTAPEFIGALSFVEA